MSLSNMQTVKKVVIVGRDIAAWLAANTLERALGRTGLCVEVAEMPTLLRPYDIVASLAPLESFHRLLGVDEAALIRAVGGSFSLGQSFVGFSSAPPAFFHPYGAHGVGINRLPFLPYWIKARQGGLNVAFEDFSLPAAAAKQGCFFMPTDEMRVFGHLDYAYHLKTSAYVQFLRNLALQRGVETTPVRLFDIERDGVDGAIKALVTNDGRRIAGDVFIDATGSESLLLGEALQTELESWSRWLPGNHVLTVTGERLPVLPSYSQVRALSAGCLHLTPVPDATGLQYVYDRDIQTDEAALETVARTAGMKLQANAAVASLAAGCRRKLWVKNCIALGEAAAGLDPIDNTGLHVIQLGLAHLISLFPVSADSRIEADEYNAQMREALDGIRDYQMAHYKLNRVEGQAFWDRPRDMRIPERLAHRIEMFKARGIVPVYEGETFIPDDWHALFIGQGLMPRSYDPLVDLMPQDTAVRHFQGFLSRIRHEVQQMQPQEAFIRKRTHGGGIGA
ncbi:MAG: tryptophan 7-halogenase [Asticcacaulis sp.]|uniref:tryptophan halogenase family protein n=1 Tax=Asticcacaulis sp. TaxID=1872648 RepID=UPI0039E3E75E